MKADTPSTTARLIAAALILAAREPCLSHLVSDTTAGWCEWFLSQSWRDRLLARSARYWPGRRLWKAVERIALPGAIDHWVTRKAWIEARVRALPPEACRQTIILGAGLDPLGVRLASEQRPRWVVELDHPSTQRLKLAALAQCPHRPNITLIPCDLTVELPDWRALASTGLIDPTADATVIAEGLLMYFTEARVRKILLSIADLPCPHLRLLFTCMSVGDGNVAQFERQSSAIGKWLARQHEPFQWGTSIERVNSLLRSTGWRCELISDIADLDIRSVPDDCKLRGEMIVDAVRI